jgi:hypothetical protein
MVRHSIQQWDCHLLLSLEPFLGMSPQVVVIARKLPLQISKKLDLRQLPNRTRRQRRKRGELR